MKVVGITGGIGSGKSVISKVFSSIGIPVYDSDAESKIILFSTEVSKEVVSYFGNEILLAGKLDRKLLAKCVFNHSEKLNWLNNLLHPKVKQHFEDWSAKQDSSYVLKEAAILFESGANESCDLVINVACPPEERMERVMKRDNRTKEDVERIIAKQLSEKERELKSDFTIVNYNCKILDQILAVHHQICAKSM